MDIEKIVREYIDRSIHMSLGTTRDNKPWVCEVHFVYDPELNLYFRSLKSRRHSLDIAINPNVAGNIVKQHSVGEPGHGIYFEGTAAVIESAAAREEIFTLFDKRLSLPKSILEDASNPKGHHFYKISVNTWYAFGLFGKEKADKYELAWHQKA